MTVISSCETTVAGEASHRTYGSSPHSFVVVQLDVISSCETTVASEASHRTYGPSPHSFVEVQLDVRTARCKMEHLALYWAPRRRTMKAPYSLHRQLA